MKPLRRESLLLLRETALWAIACVYLALLAYGCVQSADRVRSQKKQVTAATQDVHERWDKLRRRSAATAKNAWSETRSASLVGGPEGFAVLALPVDGTAALSPGESLRRSRVRRISIYTADPEPPLENPLIPAAGPFDLTFVVMWLLPLCVLATTHAAVSGSRANGTWALVLVNAPDPFQVALARILLPSVLLWGITVVAGGAAVQASGGATLDGWVRVGWWSLCAAIYTSLWAALSAWANSRSVTPAAAIRITGIAWLAAVWIVPASLDALVSVMAPPANRIESHVAAREIQRDLDKKLPEMTERVYVQHPDWRPSPETIAAATRPVPGGPASRDSRRVYTPALAAEEATRPLRELAARRTEIAEAFVSRLMILSPVLAFQSASDALAGTSSRQFSRFEREAAAATTAWHAFFAPRIFQLRELSAEDLVRVPLPTAISSTVGWLDWLGPAAILTAWLGALAAAVVWNRRMFHR